MHPEYGAADDVPAEPDKHSGLPEEFTVEDILRAPPHNPRPLTADDAERAENEARTAVWEMGFAIQEFTWLRAGAARAEALVASITSQLHYSAGCLERYPVDLLPLPDELAATLAERFEQLADEVEHLEPPWAEDVPLQEAYVRLRTSLELRGVLH